ncbi:MAG TPA: DNA mismatch repair protein MutS [Alphaproteobacteria bacterium]|nr:DNA mismatch repair protein MutS [Alphaproteobacteria bacterium]
MKVFLLHPDRDFAVKPELRDQVFDAMLSGDLFAITNVRRNLERQRNTGAVLAPTGSDAVLTQDLELDTLWNAMAAGDEFLFEMAKRAVLSSLPDPEAIVYRQRVLADCLEHPEVVRELYRLAVEALQNERQAGGLWLRERPEGILNRAVRVLKLQVGVLERLRQLAEEQQERFRSEGFRRFFAMLTEELADEYLHTVQQHLRQLEFKHGLVESAELAKGVKGRRYLVRTPPREQRWTERFFIGRRSDSFSFTIPPRDESGFQALEEIRGSGLNHVADAVAQSAEHVKSFFAMLRLELAFYLGCLNLRERLDQKGEPTCFPEPLAAGQIALTTQGVYDVCLTLHLTDRVVGNQVRADGRSLVMITGANQGGKSTLLRSLGLAQLMMQCGMFVGAQAFRASVCNGVFTHYKREEDAAMEGGKLDEELRRMSGIADQIRPGGLLLCNESFASTNEREGSEIARQVVRAMLDKQVRVAFVTHMYDLAHSLHAQQLDTALFLRAERQPDGRRTFKLIEGEPRPTSYGEDSYRRIFGTAEWSQATAAERRR